ncbi:N-carbamoylputrescine amidase [Synechococcus sp. PCC 7502]|uniref:N-carbamoylputrescine amidase n=1 Tax=Synechococcus sp. PCC 7502 TaxID=1173263 RepID=UPI00029FEDC4|nr:N-carbamoylputrescine amidase [Synechococcus sp. PCC 7502]AFY73487.1 N-carbamoylputrescine amidase [Synechococcus sp. PCC 7502]
MSDQTIAIAALQCALNDDLNTNISRVSELVTQAASQGAQVVLPPELFEGSYFCREEKDIFFDWAYPIDQSPAIAHFRVLAKQLNVIIPLSFFERDRQMYYNSLAMIDSDGEILGIYRKSHIPDGPGYEEKFYFRPGNTGFKVWQTKFGNLGVGICWDQWFPECARAMVLMGADILFYPTAIGTEPEEPTLNTKDPWQRAMIGHAVSNVIPVVAANRIGTEGNQTFYGHSFIANQRGDKVAELDDQQSGIITAKFNLGEIRRNRASFGFFRDRRPELYSILTEK